MGNTFGKLFSITTWGESHGGGVGVVIDGCPAQISISEADIQAELDKRRPGQNKLVTPRDEADKIHILSGIFEGKTLGTPISLMVYNKDANPAAYQDMKDTYRPSHADFTYEKKYGIRNWQGGGRASARETIGRVAAGAIAKKILQETYAIESIAYVTQIYQITAEINRDTVDQEAVEKSLVRCPHKQSSDLMIEQVEHARDTGDSLGGVIECVVRNVPVGLGEPVFDKLKADLAKAMMSLPATMGVEFGSGFEGTSVTGSDHNDEFYMEGDRVRTKTNRSGGMQGGISNGEDIYFLLACKRRQTRFKKQNSVTSDNKETQLQAKGRHDPCVIPRAVPIVEAMTNLVIIDHVLRNKVC